jgi:hypothetical protein
MIEEQMKPGHHRSRALQELDASAADEREARPVSGAGIAAAVLLVAAVASPIIVPAIVHALARWFAWS